MIGSAPQPKLYKPTFTSQLQTFHCQHPSAGSSDFSQARTMSRHISERARIGLRSGAGAGIDALSTTAKRSFNGKSRRMSHLNAKVHRAARRGRTSHVGAKECHQLGVRGGLVAGEARAVGCDAGTGVGAMPRPKSS